MSWTDGAANAESLDSAPTAVVTAAPNAAPTSENKTVTIDQDSAYTFSASDFTFNDTDDSDTLSSVTIVTLPAAGTLALNGVAVTEVQSIPAASLGNLVFTPAAGGSGTGYASFTFKVSDGTDLSTAAYTMSIDVTAAAPTGGLVSNTGQAHDASPNINHSAAQQFSTGSEAAGYNLASVGYWIVTKDNNSALTVTLRASVSGTPDVPGDVVHTFTSPTLVADSLNVFTAPEEATLSADTDYFLVMEETAGAITMRATASAAEDTDSHTGFSIADTRLWCNAPCGSSSWNSVSGSALQIIVDGGVASAAPNAAPTSENKTVTVAQDSAYTFSASDFTFNDTDGSDTLSSVTIVTLPAAGTLALNGVAVTLNQSISASFLAQPAVPPGDGRKRDGLCELHLQGERRHRPEYGGVHDDHQRDGGRPQQRADRPADHHRHGAGGADADREHVGHR